MWSLQNLSTWKTGSHMDLRSCMIKLTLCEFHQRNTEPLSTESQTNFLKYWRISRIKTWLIFRLKNVFSYFSFFLLAWTIREKLRDTPSKSRLRLQFSKPLNHVNLSCLGLLKSSTDVWESFAAWSVHLVFPPHPGKTHLNYGSKEGTRHRVLLSDWRNWTSPTAQVQWCV